VRFIVLGAPESWYLSDLRRAAGSCHEVVQATFRDIAANLHGDMATVNSGTLDLNSADALLVRTMPAGSLEQVVFRMDALAQVELAGQVVINPPKAIETAVDKYLALVRMQAAGLPVPRTIVCQTSDQALEAFAHLRSDVVVKPLFGAEGRGITRINDEALLLRAVRMLEELRAVLYLQEFVPHPGHDIRALVIGNKV
jgi:ribosomal protein S6--L-glutamate ligase